MLTVLNWKHDSKMYGDYGKLQFLVVGKKKSFVGCWFWNKNEGILFFLNGNSEQVKFFSSFRGLRDKPFLYTDYFQFTYFLWQKKNNNQETEMRMEGEDVQANFRYLP